MRQGELLLQTTLDGRCRDALRAGGEARGCLLLQVVGNDYSALAQKIE